MIPICEVQLLIRQLIPTKWQVLLTNFFFLILGLKLEEYLGSDPVKDLQDPSGTAKKKLLTQIKQLKSGKQTAKPDKQTGDDVMYELLMKPDTSKLEERQRLALFESRLEALEKVLGPTPDKMVS